MANDMVCKICNGETDVVFTKNVLGKYIVSYYQCRLCGFTQTEDPYWLSESYSSAITSLDIGLINRNITYARIVEKIIKRFFFAQGRFLDFAGGYGMFTRIMRDNGLDFYRQDKYCENIFAQSFDIENIDVDVRRFTLVTSFEMMEHARNPIEELDYIFSISDHFLFSTEIIPKEDFENWWYIAEEHGQHISFYSKESLSLLAKRYRKNYYTNGYLHLFTTKNIPEVFEKESKLKRFFLMTENFFDKNKAQLKSKLQEDFLMIRRKMREKPEIIFIGHSYHEKTKSSLFLIDFLKEYYTVSVIFDHSWKGNPFTDLSCVKASHKAVIFWQCLPPKDVLDSLKIKNANVILFPMYDASRSMSRDEWKQYASCKIVHFSSTLYRKLHAWGFRGTFVRYFPKPNNFLPGDTTKAFFWQRLTKINSNVIAKVLPDFVKDVHLHKAIDPYNEIVLPDKDICEKFSFTYSDWFDARSDMRAVMDPCGIYVAPREFEGIGMSFLEPMAMGKIVIGCNYPTMSEYIKDGYNGFLFDARHPKKIKITSPKRIQKNAYRFMWNGFYAWENNKHRIIDCIEEIPQRSYFSEKRPFFSNMVLKKDNIVYFVRRIKGIIFHGPLRQPLRKIYYNITFRKMR